MAQNREKLLSALAHVASAERGARFVCCLAVAGPDGRLVLESHGECVGRIRNLPAGAGGFGYDALFEVAGAGCTLAELDAEETARVGHRGRAARALLDAWHAADR
jgi:XTP/dITP diphosphohydrolase